MSWASETPFAFVLADIYLKISYFLGEGGGTFGFFWGGLCIMQLCNCESYDSVLG